MPDECMPDQVHVVSQAKINKSIGRAKVIATRTLSRLNERPLQVVLGADLVELLLDLSNVLGQLLWATTESPSASCDGSIDSRADIEMVFEGILEEGRLGSSGSCAGEQQYYQQPSHARAQSGKVQLRRRHALRCG